MPKGVRARMHYTPITLPRVWVNKKILNSVPALKSRPNHYRRPQCRRTALMGLRIWKIFFLFFFIFNRESCLYDAKFLYFNQLNAQTRIISR